MPHLLQQPKGYWENAPSLLIDAMPLPSDQSLEFTITIVDVDSGLGFHPFVTQFALYANGSVMFQRSDVQGMGGIEASTAATYTAESTGVSNRIRANRADVLLDNVEMQKHRPRLVPESYFVLHFKNYGKTRADDTRIDFRLTMGSIGTFNLTLGPTLFGSGVHIPLSSQTFRELGAVLYLPELESGRIPMKLEGTISYRDVFAVEHKTSYSGWYDVRARIFNMRQTPSPL